MDKKSYFEYHKNFVEKMQDIARRKNADYTGINQDPFSNFSKAEQLGICSTEQGFLVRMSDKFSRITSFVQKGVLEVEDEKVEDTLQDLANYCILFSAYIISKKKGDSNE